MVIFNSYVKLPEGSTSVVPSVPVLSVLDSRHPPGFIQDKKESYESGGPW